MRLRHVGFMLLLLVVVFGGASDSRGAKPADTFRPIFNGKDLTGWSGDERFWRVEDGAIVGETTEDSRAPGNTFLIWEQGELDDFELRLKFRMTSDYANSGVQIRSVRLDKHVVGGYQADLANDGWTGVMYEERGRGILAHRGERATIAADGSRTATAFGDKDALHQHMKLRDWNDYHIIARGNRITIRLNGETMSELIDESPAARRHGVLALQVHAGPPMRVAFKDIELKRVPVEGKKKVVLVAGRPSHGYGEHEHNAGCMLFARLLNEHTDNIFATVYRNGWPSDPTAFDNADSVVIYADGGRGHPVMPHLQSFDVVMKRGVGLVCIHYAVEVMADESGKYFLDWIGGYFEPHWSVNPHWTIKDMKLGKPHAITRGVEPYELNDEWYYHMRFPDRMEGVDAIITALPPAESLTRPDGPHSGNPHVRKAVLEHKHPQHTAWARQRPDGGRGFGFTGGHFHWNWGHPEHLKLVLNAIAWTADATVPEQGITVPALTFEDLEANLDGKQPSNFNRPRLIEQVKAWNE